MIDKLDRNSKRVIIENIISLYIVQGLNYLLPLIVLPYLVRTIGASKYGLISFAISFASYFVVIVDYGFNLTATKKISSNRNDKAIVSKVFYTTYGAKAVLTLICFIVFMAILFIVPKFHEEALTFIISYIAVFGNMILPIWYFQGIENLKTLALLNLISKIILSILIFIFIHKQSDYVLAMIFQVSSVVVSGLLCLLFIFYNKAIVWYTPNINDIVSELKDGWYVFLSQISVNLFSNTGIFILGIYQSHENVGYYAIADKIVKAFIGMVAPICNAIYPRSCQLFNVSTTSALMFLRKVLIFGSSIILLLCILLFIFTNQIVFIVVGTQNNLVVLMVRVMLILPLTNFIDNIYGTQILLNIGKSKDFMKAILFSGLFSVITSLIFVPKYGGIASSLIFAITGILIMTLMIYYAKKYNIRLFTVINSK